MKISFDSSLGKHGGTRYRGDDGRLASNPNRDKSWYCQKSPTGAHHWLITKQEGRCKYCSALCELATSVPPIARKQSRDS